MSLSTIRRSTSAKTRSFEIPSAWQIGTVSAALNAQERDTKSAKACGGAVVSNRGLRLARVDAYVALSTLVWRAIDARHKHGPNSAEYAAAKAQTDAAREVFGAACDAERAA